MLAINEENKALDAEIAETVMGWTKTCPDNGNWYFHGHLWQAPRGWSPSTDLKAAMQVVDRLCEGGFVVELIAQKSDWCCRISKNANLLTRKHDVSLSLAIARAAWNIRDDLAR